MVHVFAEGSRNKKPCQLHTELELNGTLRKKQESDDETQHTYGHQLPSSVIKDH